MSEEVEPWVDPDRANPWDRISGENKVAYIAFMEYARLGHTRSYSKLADATGIGVEKIRKYAKNYSWKNRVTKYDLEVMRLNAANHPKDVGEARDAQIDAGNKLLELGLEAMHIKNPSLININTALKLIQSGVDIQRKAYGEADINISMTSTDLSRVHNLLEELDYIEAEVVDDQQEDSTEV